MVLRLQLGNQGLGSDAAVGVGENSDQLVPIGIDVEADADPAAVADVRWSEKSVGFLPNQQLLRTNGRCTPDADNTVSMVVVEEHDKGFLAANEECGRSVAEAFAHLGQVETCGANMIERNIR